MKKSNFTKLFGFVATSLFAIPSYSVGAEELDSSVVQSVELPEAPAVVEEVITEEVVVEETPQAPESSEVTSDQAETDLSDVVTDVDTTDEIEPTAEIEEEAKDENTDPKDNGQNAPPVENEEVVEDVVDEKETEEEVIEEEETEEALKNVTADWNLNTVNNVKEEVERQLKAQESGSSNVKIYVVQWGDTLSIIAEAIGIDIIDIARANEISNLDFIIAGDLLLLDEAAITSSIHKSTEFSYNIQSDSTNNTPTQPSTGENTSDSDPSEEITTKPEVPAEPEVPAIPNNVFPTYEEAHSFGYETLFNQPVTVYGSFYIIQVPGGYIVSFELANK